MNQKSKTLYFKIPPVPELNVEIKYEFRRYDIN